ncbi:MAG: Ldh family oxidoreductase [Alphaproteobacteria bacterium]
MIATKTLSLDEIERMACDALVACGASSDNARAVAVAVRETEAEGIASHGLAYVPIYAEHLNCGKVDGGATPIITKAAASLLRADAKTGFAQPAILAGFNDLIPMAKANGIAALSVSNSYNCGVLGFYTRQLALAGLVGIGFTNAPASIAPAGGSKPVIGTNPFSIATPNKAGEPDILIDQSASAIAKSEVMKHLREEKDIPLGWALDQDGNPTTDPKRGLAGSMVPSGGYKGVGIGLLVEIMAAALSGAHLGIEASPFSGTAGGPPKTGQFFIAIAPELSAGGGFADKIAMLTQAITAQSGARLPGSGRKNNRDKAMTSGVAVSLKTIDQISTFLS